MISVRILGGCVYGEIGAPTAAGRQQLLRRF